MGSRHQSSLRRRFSLVAPTLHLCEALSIDDFRRETLQLLDHGEHVHALQRQGRRQEELVAQSGSLTLLTNIVMARNTARIQASVAHWRTTNRRRTPIEALRHVSPAGFEHIKFDGVFMFPAKQFRSRLLPSSAAPVVHAE